MNKLLIVVTVIFVAFMISCNADEDEVFEPQSEEILCFESYQEYSDELEKVIKMNYEERQEWQNNKGFNSLGVKSDFLYQNIDIQQYGSVKDVQSFVSENIEYLQLIKQGQDFTLEPILYQHPERYFVNKLRIFQIGDEIYKVFGDGIAKTEDIYIDQLLAIENFENVRGYNNIDIFKSDEPNLKSLDCHNSDIVTQTDGDERIKLEYKYYGQMNTDNIEPGSATSPSGYKYMFEYKARAYKRTLGIWFWAKRTITADVNVILCYTDENNESLRKVIRTGTLMNFCSNSVIEGKKTWSVPYSYDATYDRSIVAVRCWAKQRGCSKNALIECKGLYFDLLDDIPIVHPPVVLPNEIGFKETDLVF